MNKNVGNLKFEIGNLFFDKDSSKYGSSAGKIDGVSEFSSCLSKVSDRDDRAAVQNNQDFNKSIKVDKKSNDFEKADNVAVEKQLNKSDAENNTDKVDKTEQNQNIDTTVDENVTDTTEIVEDAVMTVAGIMVDPSLNIEVNTEISDVNTEVTTVEAIDAEMLTMGAPEYNSVGDTNSGMVGNGDFTSNESFGEVLVEADVMAVDAEMNTTEQTTSTIMTDDSVQTLNAVENSITAETVNVVNVNVNARGDQINVVANSSVTAENVVSLDEAVAEDIVSVNISEGNFVQNTVTADNAVTVETTIAQSAVVEDEPEIKIGNEENSENIGEVKLNFAEQADVVSETENATQSESENDALSSDGFDESLDSEINSDIDPQITLNDRVDVRTVNLHNVATRHTNAAQAVQNTIIQNTADMVGRLESKSMELMLNPENLGKIVIRMQSTAEGLNIKIIADNLDINRGLELRMFQIENTIKAQGVNLNNIEIEHASVSDNSTSEFTGFENSAREFEGFAEQNQNSSRSSREEYIEYTEYSYEDVEGGDINPMSDNGWRTGSSNVEFLA